MGKNRYSCGVLLESPEGRKTTGRPRYRWEYCCELGNVHIAQLTLAVLLQEDREHRPNLGGVGGANTPPVYFIPKNTVLPTELKRGK